MPVRALPVLQNWDCHGCADCCRTYAVRVSDEERLRLAKQAWSHDPAMAGIETIIRDEQTGGYRLNHTADGTCVFLDADNRCRIHARLGAAAKPMACRIYPFVLVPGGDHWRVGIRFACPSALANNGTPLNSKLSELGEYAALVEADQRVPEGGNPPTPLQPGQTIDWPDQIRFMKALLDLVQNNEFTIERRLRQIVALAKLCRESQFDNVTGTRLSEFLSVVSRAMQLDVPADPQHVPRPGWVGRNFFRQQLAIYCRKDNGPNAGIGTRGRWRRMRAAWRFARGTGQVPRLHGLIPDIQFSQGETPRGSMNKASEDLLTRYYSVKILSLQFCGTANFGRHFWDGLDSLLMTFPTMMWLSRVLTTAERNRESAIEQSLRIVDDNFGYNQLLGTGRQTWANRMLAERGEIARLIAWYGK